MTMYTDTDGHPKRKRPAGFIIDVPVTLSVAVRGEVTEEQAFEIARNFADGLAPSDHYVAGYMSTMKEEQGVEWEITEVSLESSSEDSCQVLEELEEDDEG